MASTESRTAQTGLTTPSLGYVQWPGWPPPNTGLRWWVAVLPDRRNVDGAARAVWAEVVAWADMSPAMTTPDSESQPDAKGRATTLVVGSRQILALKAGGKIR